MAILAEVPGLRVEVFVNGKALQEYDDDETAPPKTITKYIEAVTGQNFEIRYSFIKPFPTRHSVKVKIELDGKVMEGVVFSKRKILVATDRTSKGAYSSVDGKAFISKYRFSEIAIDQDNGRLVNQREREKISTIGLITVTFDFVTLGRSRKPSHNVKALGNRASDTIPEKLAQVNALTHHTILDKAEKIQTKERSTRKIDLSAPPFATFNFKYRSLAALKSLYIIPRTPSPVPLEERPEEELSVAELQELVKRYKDQVASTKSVKDEARFDREIKRELVKHEASVERGVKRERVEDDDEVTFLRTKRVEPDRRGLKQRGEVIELD